MEPLAGHLVDLVWLPIAFVLLGSALGTLVLRWLRVPAFFWLPLVYGAASLISYGIFYVCFFDAFLGRRLASWALIISVAAFAWQLADRSVRRLLSQRDAWLPGVLLALVTIAYICLLAWPETSASYRFRFPLPPEDNNAQRVLADRIDWGLYHHGTPPPIMDHGYRSSDRPPLLSGITLALRPWQQSANDWSYQIIGIFCELGWIPALYALARVVGLERRQLIVVMIACVTSGFFFLNSIYTWPKLLAGMLFLSAFALLLYRLRKPDEPLRLPTLLVMAGLVALALLSHGGPFFSLLAMPILLLRLRPWPRVRVRDVVLACALGATLLAPWLAYQKLYDPPGDRLWKIHFAGLPQDEDKDTRPFLRALREEYGKLTLSEYLDGRWANVKEQFFILGKAPTDDLVFYLQWQQFFHHLAALDFLLLGFAALLIPRIWRSSDPRHRLLRNLTGYTFLTIFIWLWLLLMPSGALIHHSSYANVALMFFCAGAWLALLPRAVTIGAVVLHAALFVWVWASWPNQPPPFIQHGNPLYVIVAAAGLIAFAILLRLVPDSHDGAAGDAATDYASQRTYSKSTGSRLTPLDGGAM